MWNNSRERQFEIFYRILKWSSPWLQPHCLPFSFVQTTESTGRFQKLYRHQPVPKRIQLMWQKRRVVMMSSKNLLLWCTKLVADLRTYYRSIQIFIVPWLIVACCWEIVRKVAIDKVTRAGAICSLIQNEAQLATTHKKEGIKTNIM